jgi:hypothetical protein
MSEKISLSKNVYSKTQFEKTVDTQFTQLSSPALTAQIETQTVAQFFNNYQTLFYQIPKEGENNSHQYLIKTSQDYAGAVQNDTDLTALLDEIDSLRLTIFEQQQTISTLISDSTNGGTNR